MQCAQPPASFKLFVSACIRKYKFFFVFVFIPWQYTTPRNMIYEGLWVIQRSHKATWQETHLHVRSVLCHLRPDRAYLFLLLLLLFFSMSSLPTISGREHRGLDMSLTVSSSKKRSWSQNVMMKLNSKLQEVWVLAWLMWHVDTATHVI